MLNNSEKRKASCWRCCMLLTVATLLVFGADQLNMLSGARTVLHDAFSPGRMILLAMTAGAQTSKAFGGVDQAERDDDLEAMRQALHESELQRRQLIIAHARTRNELRSLQNLNSLMKRSSELGPHDWIGFDTVAAQVISRDGLPDRLRELIIDAGRDSGVTQHELIVEGAGLVVDRGRDHDVVAGSRVLDGAIVVGRVAQVARWVSLIQPVTSPEFSARVKLVRSTGDGSHAGPEGVLEGTGNGDCIIRGIPYTASVNAGDDVFAVDVQGISGPSLYFGRVSTAEFLSGGEWSVTVTPAANLASMETVAVVRPEVLPSSDSQTREEP